jgi:hypothetical protein
MNKLAILSITCAVLSACSQNPQFKISTANKVYSALNDLQVLLAKAELGLVSSPASFAKTSGDYAKIMGGFETGRFTAVGISQSVDVLDADSLNPEVKVIASCVAQVRTMAETHRSTGIDPASDIIPTVRQSCGAAARSVAANESSALILSTAAGDL